MGNTGQTSSQPHTVTFVGIDKKIESVDLGPSRDDVQVNLQRDSNCQASYTFNGKMGIVCGGDGIVQLVNGNTPAKNQGIKVGDKIVNVDTNPFSMDRLIEAEANGSDYNVTLVRHEDGMEPLGVSLLFPEGKCLYVKELRQEGLMISWNEKHVGNPQAQVRAGDIIISVNGVAMNAQAMLQELKKNRIAVNIRHTRAAPLVVQTPAEVQKEIPTQGKDTVPDSQPAPNTPPVEQVSTAATGTETFPVFAEPDPKEEAIEAPSATETEKIVSDAEKIEEPSKPDKEENGTSLERETPEKDTDQAQEQGEKRKKPVSRLDGEQVTHIADLRLPAEVSEPRETNGIMHCVCCQ